MSINPLSRNFLAMGVNSCLNPSNKDQGVVNTYLGKPVRFIGRLGWGLGAYSIGAICGVAYNIIQATRYSFSNKEISANYFDAAVGDAKAFTCLAGTAGGIFLILFGGNSTRALGLAGILICPQSFVMYDLYMFISSPHLHKYLVV